MPCSNHTGEYLTYNCFSKLEYLFDISKLSEDGKEIFNKTIEHFKGSPFINANNKTISDLARFLTADAAFTNYGYDVSCMFINFWLNKQVKNSYKDEYKSIFKYFDDFASKFAEERKKKSSFGYSCKTHINELVGDKYRIKQILYNLYDFYTKHKSYLHDRNRVQLCNNINIIVKESHNASDYIKQDEHFAKRLKELKILIQTEKYQKENCHYSSLINMLPKDYPIPKIETSILPVHKPTVTDQLPIPQHKDLNHGGDEISGNVHTTLLVNEGLPQASKLQEEESLPGTTPSEESEELQPLSVFPRERSHKTFPEVDRLDTTWPQAGRFLERDRESPRTQVHSFDDTQDIRSQTGVLGTIQNTFSDVLASVEPAPILGVSGGMGALFLLFKYTPVGTFFRGGTVRARRIPSGFSGPFPGDFSNFQEYGGGFVGYSPMDINPLAE
ncbi:PIR protein [Plasmodium vivax]|nr:PIR protein [Plasmodium vivax]